MKIILTYLDDNGKATTKVLDNVSHYTVLSDDAKHTLDVGFTYNHNDSNLSVITHAGEHKFESLLSKLHDRGFDFPEFKEINN